jgi:hypothetical protein
VSSSLNGLRTTVLFQCLSSRGVGVARPEAAKDDKAALQAEVKELLMVEQSLDERIR